MITFTKRMHDIPERFLPELLRFTGISGAVIAAASLAVFLGGQRLLGVTVGEARTMLLSTVVPLSLINFLVIVGGRHWRQNLRRNWEFCGFAGCVALLYYGVLTGVTRLETLAPVREFLEVEGLSAAAVCLTLGVTVVAGALLGVLQLGRRG
jgi:hypothetical protein